LQRTLAALAGGALALVQKQAPLPPSTPTACSDTATISALARLPPGLVLADIDLGPYIVALTPHRVVMAPYHRIDRSIIEGHRLLAARPEAAEAGVRKLGVAYLAACRKSAAAARRDGSAHPPAADQSLDGAIASGHAPAYLEPVPLPAAPELRVYRVRPPQS
jgi:hypothetical protein